MREQITLDPAIATELAGSEDTVLKALEAVNGDLSGGQEAFREELSNVVHDDAFGTINLDENRQTIANNYLQQLKDYNSDGTI